MSHARAWLVAAMAVLHAGALLGPWVAPYDPAAQHREFSYAPPTAVHVVDPYGVWHWPFVCARSADSAAGRTGPEDCARRFPVHLFATPDAARPGGIARSWRLYGVAEPGRIFLLGTDVYGRDQVSRLIVGARVSLLAALLGTGIAVGLGLFGGMLAGYIGGPTDRALTAAGSVFQAIPVLYLLLATRAALPLTLGPADAFLATTALLGTVGWARPYRLVRAATLATRDADYVSAARGLGASTGHILGHHVLGAVSGVAGAQVLVLVPQFMLAEVTLSFFGLGVAEPMPSWGTMLADSLRVPVLSAGTWLLAPAVALVAVSVLYYGMILALRLETSRLD